MPRQLRFSYTFPSGYVQPYPALAPNSINFIALSGLANATTPTQAEITSFTAQPVVQLPLTFLFSASVQFLCILVPAQLGLVQTFTVGGSPIPFVLQASNDIDSLNDTGSNVGEPYFIDLNGIQYAYNLYVSQFSQTGNIIVTVPALTG